MGTAHNTGLNDIDDIPKAWRYALTALQIFWPEAMMAGGCLRDREHGVAVKDIDIFLPGERIDDAQHIANLLTREGWKNVSLDNGMLYMGELVACVNGSYPGAPPIQINVGKWGDMDRIAERMDFGICQIAFDGKRIHRTKAYHRDRVSKHFRVEVDCDDMRYVRSINRWARLKEKYPTWQFHMGSRATSVGGGTLASGGSLTRVVDAATQFVAGGLIKHSMRQLFQHSDGLHPAFSAGYIRKQPKDVEIFVNDGNEVVLPVGMGLSEAGKSQLRQILSEGRLKNG